MKSPAYSFKGTATKIATGACIAILGALATYLMETIPTVDFGAYSALVVALNSILVNAIKNFIQSY